VAKNLALRSGAKSIRRNIQVILEANGADVKEASANRAEAAFIDRLALTRDRVLAMADGLDEVAELTDPIGEVIGNWTRPNGLRISRVRVPLGVIGIIYESRPNVTADAAGLCLKAGNASILRGGSEALRSNLAIANCIQEGLVTTGLPGECVQVIDTADRDVVGELLQHVVGESGVGDVQGEPQ